MIFEEMIKRIEQIKQIKHNNNLENDIIIALFKRFIYYISDYHYLFRIKCTVCCKNVKYSLQEKCFFPPFYKRYIIEDFNNKDKKKTEENCFYHEECFRHKALPCI